MVNRKINPARAISRKLATFNHTTLYSKNSVENIILSLLHYREKILLYNILPTAQYTYTGLEINSCPQVRD
jgi:hypothetical protein